MSHNSAANFQRAVKQLSDMSDIHTSRDVTMIPEKYPALFNTLVKKYNVPNNDQPALPCNSVQDAIELMLYTTVTDPYIAAFYTPQCLGYAFFSAADRVFAAKEYVRVLRETGVHMTLPQLSEYVSNHDNPLREIFAKGLR